MPATTFPNQYRLFDIVQARLALTLDEHRLADVLRVVEEMIAAREVRDLDGLVQKLSEQPITAPIWQKIIRIATIGETYFFRDLNQLNAVRYSILPKLIEERRSTGQRHLRLWSAGCSTGEEPYTLAMMLRDLIPDYSSWSITILATDLNLNNIERARNAVFRPWSFRAETPSDLRQRWFTEEQGTYRIDRSIRDMVVFAPLNLASDDYPSFTNGTTEMDVIFCRNVLIYFDNPTTAAVISRFHRSLQAQGWLVLGHSETAHIPTQDFDPHNFENAVLYQKKPFVEPANVAPTLVEVAPISMPPRHTKPTPRPTPWLPPQRVKTTSTPLVAASPDPWELARRAADREHWREALDYLAQAEKLQKLRPEIHYLRGIIEIQQNEQLSALESLRRSIYCDGNFILAHFALGELYEKRGNLRKAAYEWNQAQTILARKPQDEIIAFSDELTVEMMSRLLQFRLDRLPIKD